MKTITAPLSKGDKTTRNLAHISLLFLPLHGMWGLLSSSAEHPFTYSLAMALLQVAIVTIACTTRHRATAIVALLMPLASIPLTILIILCRAAGNW